MSLTQVTYAMISNAAANVRDYGAVGDGIADDTTAIRAAMTAANTVYFPAGTYLIKGANDYLTDGLQLKSNQTVYGDGAASIIQQHSTSFYAMSANQGTGGTTNPADNMKNIVIRDLAFVNTTGTFAEFQHMLNLNAVSNVVVERCTFRGFRGDGIYLGSSNVANTERHNQNVTIRDCVFDGVNNENRNGISIIDGNTVVIERNVFTNVTKSGQPGCVDVEPDNFAFPIIRNITIRSNRMQSSLGGGVALLLGYANNPGASPPVNIHVHDNYMNGCLSGVSVSVFSTPTEASPNCNILVAHNTIEASTGSMCFFDGCSGVTVANNQFISNPNKGEIGYLYANYNLSFIGNTFKDNGRTSTDCLWIRSATLLTFDSNVFCDNGSAVGAGRDMNFLATYTGSRIYLRNNVFTSPGGYTSTSIEVDATYTLNNGNSQDINNVWTYVATIEFFGNGSDRFTAAPAAGTWARGNAVYNATPSAGGTPGWVCTTAGSPGTWKAMANLAP